MAQYYSKDGQVSALVGGFLRMGQELTGVVSCHDRMAVVVEVIPPQCVTLKCKDCDQTVTLHTGGCTCAC